MCDQIRGSCWCERNYKLASFPFSVRQCQNHTPSPVHTMNENTTETPAGRVHPDVPRLIVGDEAQRDIRVLRALADAVSGA